MTEATSRATAWLASFLAPADEVVLVAWLVGSVVSTTIIVSGLWRLMRRTRRWAHAHVRGEDVLLSDGFGPALVGFLSPKIVVPTWALGLDDEQLRMTLLHEAEHRTARDTLLLLGSSIAVALTPWNAALWWASSRLRQAVELDCDARVLRAGVSRSAYGGLLIDLSTGPHLAPLSVAALSKSTSLLERRLEMMTNDVSRVGPVRMVGLAVVVGLLAVSACEAPTPSAIHDVEPELSAIPAVQGEYESQAATVLRSSSVEEAPPLIYVDGVRISGATLDELDPRLIERIEVIKGRAAMGLFGESAANGVIQIFTRAAPRELEGSERRPPDFAELRERIRR